MIIIKLDYFTLLSPEPINLHGVGNIISPTLRSISKLNYNVYNIYLDALLTDIKSYYDILDKNGDLYLSQHTQTEKDLILQLKNEYENLSEQEKTKLSFFDILIFDEFYKKRVLEALNFFILENVVYSDEEKAFLIYDSENIDTSSAPIGALYHDNYEVVINIILQRVGMAREDIDGDNVKTKNKAAAKILEKIKNAIKQDKKKNKKADKKMELPNIISSLATHSKNLNMVNIWDLTVYQLYDQFARQQIDDSYSISAAQVSAWGDKDNKFDGTLWFSVLKEN